MVVKLFFYKLKAYSSYGVALIILQLMSIVFYGGGYSTGMSNTTGAYFVHVQIYQSNLMIPFLYGASWIGILAAVLSLGQNLRYDFHFITNRKMTNLANILLIAASSVYCGITMILSHLASRFFRYLISPPRTISVLGFKPPATDILLSMAAVTLYLLLIGSFVYFLGSLFFRNIFLAILFAAAAIAAAVRGYLIPVIYFFVNENSLLVFTVKCLVWTAILFAASIFLSNQREVA